MPARQRAVTARKVSHGNAETVNFFPCRTDGFFSFIKRVGEPDEPLFWAFPDVSLSYVILPPPPEPDRAACYAASLAADDLLEDFRAALRDRDDLAARMALHTLVGLAKVVTGQLGGSPSENRSLQ
jgi:hypothetical protein